MKRYIDWINRIHKDKGKYELCELGSVGNIKMFRLKETFWKKRFKYYRVNFHIWNISTSMWQVTTDYITACAIFNMKAEDERDQLCQ